MSETYWRNSTICCQHIYPTLGGQDQASLVTFYAATPDSPCTMWQHPSCGRSYLFTAWNPRTVWCVKLQRQCHIFSASLRASFYKRERQVLILALSLLDNHLSTIINVLEACALQKMTASAYKVMAHVLRATQLDHVLWVVWHVAFLASHSHHFTSFPSFVFS